MGNWSGDAQLFVGGQPGDALAFALPVAKTGSISTRAPYLNHGPRFPLQYLTLASTANAWAIRFSTSLRPLQVIASGRVNLTTRRLSGGPTYDADRDGGQRAEV